jgi:hypothetical protein
MNELDDFYLEQPELIKGYLLALRDLILNADSNITNAWKYRMAFFCYKGKMFCYLHVDRKTNQPYIGFVEGNKLNDISLISGNRARMKVMYLNPEKDIPLKKIQSLLKQALKLYKTGANTIK